MQGLNGVDKAWQMHRSVAISVRSRFFFRANFVRDRNHQYLLRIAKANFLEKRGSRKCEMNDSRNEKKSSQSN